MRILANLRRFTAPSQHAFAVRWGSSAVAQLSADTAEATLKQRNIGISAHIDSGKTTLTERILYYTGRIKDIHEVRGKDGVGAKMDSMDLEREKGITIASAATHASWNDHTINIIDTPGHVDFTIEVERALRVLDGAVLVLCGVSGVQSQSLTVDRQMKRYGVPRVTFINKLDRAGSNPWRIIEQVEDKLGLTTAAVHLPIGLESELSGIIDIIEEKAIFFEGEKGENLRYEDVPSQYTELLGEKKRVLIEKLADIDEEFGDKYLMEEPISKGDIHDAIRRATLSKSFSPVFLGSALKNTGVQTLLDGVLRYLPSPNDKANNALKRIREDGELKEETTSLSTDANAPLVCLAFKLEESRFGQLTYVRVYQGTLKRGEPLFNTRTGKKTKVPRLVRMHSSEMEDIEEAKAGDICAMFGLECASGDTFVDSNDNGNISMESLFVPEPVMSLAIEPKKKDSGGNSFGKALSRFTREDPTLRVHMDAESKQTIISGMGELHLDIYIERMLREYKCELNVGAPRVNYRESIRKRGNFNYTHKKQSGGSGQFACVMGYIEPTENGKDVEFVNSMVGNNISPGFFPAIERGFKEALQEGTLTGHPVQGVRMVITDGKTHSVDSNEIAFRMASIHGFRQAFHKSNPNVLEPIMRVEVQAPSEFQGAVMGGISKRRGVIVNNSSQGDYVCIEAEVPLGEMFGYSTLLRSMTAGKGEFTMEFIEHRSMPSSKELEEEYQKKKAEGR